MSKSIDKCCEWFTRWAFERKTSIINPADVNSDVGNESNTGISSPSPPLFPGPEAGNYSKSQRFCEKIQ